MKFQINEQATCCKLGKYLLSRDGGKVKHEGKIFPPATANSNESRAIGKQDTGWGQKTKP